MLEDSTESRGGLSERSDTSRQTGGHLWPLEFVRQSVFQFVRIPSPMSPLPSQYSCYNGQKCEPVIGRSRQFLPMILSHLVGGFQNFCLFTDGHLQTCEGRSDADPKSDV